MAEYCTEADVRNRLTSNGYLNLGDRDGDGVVNSTEVSAYITSAIEWAGAEIDYALINHQPPYELSAARSSGNVFLRSRAVDLAAWRVSTHGGREPPDPFESAYQRTVTLLEGIHQQGLEVPGLQNGNSVWQENSHAAFEVQSRAVT